MPTTLTLNPEILGQAENAQGAIMERILGRAGITFHHWVVLSVVSRSEGTVARDQLVGRVTAALKIDAAAVAATISELDASGLLDALPGEASRLRMTDTGQARYGQIRAAVDEVTTRLYGEFPADDLATAGRVLTIITARANAELAHD
jgi:DNA-binding MarR family transcriptional regulator